MRKWGPARQIRQPGGAIKGAFIGLCKRFRSCTPANHAIGVAICVLIGRTESLKKTCQKILRSRVKIDPGGFRGKINRDLGPPQPKAESSTGRAHVVFWNG